MRELAGAGAKDACVLAGDGTERRVPVAALRPGDRFVVRPGETIAADGAVMYGQSAVDRSMMTGESVPVDAAEGDSVTAGTVAVSGRLIVRAAKVGKDTQLAHLVALVEEAQTQKAAIQRLADRISAVFVPAILAMAVLTLAGWLVAGSPGEQAFSAALAVLIIACPCALGLATPAALVVASGRGAQLGIFIKGHQALESSRSVDTVVLDKTGTVTTGVMAVTEVQQAAGTSRAGLLQYAGAVEQASEHAVAAAITACARSELGPLPQADGFTALPGLGARGVVDGHDVIVGREKLLRDRGLDIPAEMAAQGAAWERAGRTVVLAGWDGQAHGAVAVADTVKPSAAAAVRALRLLGLRTILLTGDNQATADAVAAEAGIGEVIAGAMPADKVAVVTGLQAQGRLVAMVGDGVNDGPALAAADLGLAIGSGTDVALTAADMILLRDDLGAVPEAIKLARATLATIRRNLAWAFGYNIAAIPLAAAGFLNPLIAGAAMAASSAFVVGNSARLRRFGLPATARGPWWRTAGPPAGHPAADGSEAKEQAASCLE
jgi:cation-transporting P-type ATPase A/B/Cu+-exporting ATPase